MNIKSLILIILFLLIFLSSFSQRNLLGNEGICEKNNGQNFVGKTVKIWSNGGIYEKINTTNALIWPSDEIKIKSGINYWNEFYPQTGDTGTVIHAFKFNRKRVPSAKNIYLLNIRGYYVPIGCGYLTTVEGMDKNEEIENWRLQEFLKNQKYANGCSFKTSYYNNGYFKAGAFDIDSIAETYACELISKGTDTILVIKYFFDNHGITNSLFESILWIEDEKGYSKVFENTENIIIEHEIDTINFKKIENYFFDNEIYSIDTKPQTKTLVIHDFTYFIQFKFDKIFYTEFITETELKEDPSHKKSIWWSMIIESIKKP